MPRKPKVIKTLVEKEDRDRIPISQYMNYPRVPDFYRISRGAAEPAPSESNSQFYASVNYPELCCRCNKFSKLSKKVNKKKQPLSAYDDDKPPAYDQLPPTSASKKKNENQPMTSHCRRISSQMRYKLKIPFMTCLRNYVGTHITAHFLHPEKVPDSVKILVSHIPPQLTYINIFNIFKGYYPIFISRFYSVQLDNCQIRYSKIFVISDEMANAACAKEDGKVLLDHTLRVRLFRDTSDQFSSNYQEKTTNKQEAKLDNDGSSSSCKGSKEFTKSNNSKKTPISEMKDEESKFNEPPDSKETIVTQFMASLPIPENQIVLLKYLPQEIVYVQVVGMVENYDPLFVSYPIHLEFYDKTEIRFCKVYFHSERNARKLLELNDSIVQNHKIKLSLMSEDVYSVH